MFTTYANKYAPLCFGGSTMGSVVIRESGLTIIELELGGGVPGLYGLWLRACEPTWSVINGSGQPRYCCN